MDKIIYKLKYFNKNFPREALKEAMKMKEEITPILLEELDKIIASPKISTKNQDYMLHIYAIYYWLNLEKKEHLQELLT